MTDPIDVPDDRLSAVETRLAAWHERAYPGGVNLSRTFAKVIEEVGELGKAIGSGTADDLAEEAADVVIVLFHLCRGIGRSLRAALLAKLAVIEERLTNPAAGRKEKPGGG